jgi:hypothetical protein
MCDSALAQHIRTLDGVLGLNLFGGGEAVTTSSEESEAVEDIEHSARNQKKRHLKKRMFGVGA